MKRYFNILLVMPLLFSLSSCALFEASNNDKNIVFVKQKAGIGVKQVVDEILENYL